MLKLMRCLLVPVILGSWYSEVSCTIRYAVVVPPQDSGSEHHLFVSNPNSGAQVTVKSVSSEESINLQLNRNTKVPDIWGPFTLTGSGVTNKTLIVESDHNDTVLQGFVKSAGGHTEGYLGLPDTKLGTDYIVSTFCVLGGYCQLAVSAIEQGDTVVTITFLSHVTDIVFCVGQTFFRSRRGQQIITLQKYDVIFMETPHDLSGTRVVSSRKVAVFSGARNMTIQGTTADLIEQLPPTSLFGRKFVIKTLGSDGYGDILHIASSMPNNRITMQGYRTFTIADTAHVVQRRLDGSTSTFIQAAYPIQVTQFSGLPYSGAANNTVFTPGMTVVPAVDQHIGTTLLSCGEGITQGNYHTVSTSSGSVVPYTDYYTNTDTWNSDTAWSQTDTTGILQCNDSILMPVGIAMNQGNTVSSQSGMTYADQVDNDNDEDIDEDFCTLDTKVEIRSLTETGIVDRHAENIENAQLVKLRLITCGIGLVKLKKSNGDRILLEISRTTMLAVTCNPDCSAPDEVDISSYNIADNCGQNILFFWLRFEDNIGMCVGPGPIPASDCTPPNTPVLFLPETSETFKVMELSAIVTEATFYVDILRKDCAAVANDYRCENKRSDCNLYGTDVCVGQYEPWMDLYCREFCEKCVPDGRGGEFLAVVAEKAVIAVTSAERNPGIGVTLNDKTVQLVDSDGTTSLYLVETQSSTFQLVYIRSVANISVSVLYYQSNRLQTYNVLPFDALGYEYMAFTYCGSNTCECVLAAREVNTKVKIYTKENVILSQQGEILVTFGTPMTVTTSENITGTVFVADQPLYVYCGQLEGSTYVHFNQMTPTNTWGKTFVTPGLEQNVLNRPYEGRLRILANVDNTLVTIGGDFDALHPLYKRGDSVDVDIDVATVYTIEATFPIAVGLLLYDVTKEKGEAISFTLVPPRDQLTNIHNMNVYGGKIISLLDSSFEPMSYTFYGVNESTGTNITGEPEYLHHLLRSLPSNQSSPVVGVVRSSDDWFVMPGLQTVRKIHRSEEECVISTGSVADSSDNDCDGLNDEDVCVTGYGVKKYDYDHDGGFGEDCFRVETVAPQLSMPDEPNCIEVRNVSGQCWMICDCQCAWLENLARKESTPRDQYLAEQANKSEAIKETLTVDSSTLASTKAEKVSAGDKRQSATSIGYMGIALFVLVFGSIFVMDINSLLRDARIIRNNLIELARRTRAVFYTE